VKYKFVIVGKGTSGAISAVFIKKFWGDFVDVTLVHDSNQKTIGVGESLTPIIYDFFNFVGITREELIKNVNATIKLGLKFQNWTGDGSGFYHNFIQLFAENGFSDNLNIVGAYDIANKKFDNQVLYGNFLLENNLVPINSKNVQSLHFDATLMSEYILERFKDELNLIDGRVVETIKKEKDIIEYLQLEDGRKVYGDFFIDASGFNSILFKSFNRTWVDKSDWMPLDRCIPNPIAYEHTEINPYTTAEACVDGWILQVPLQDRWGAGYLYSSEFTSDEQAFENFEKFVGERFANPLGNKNRIIKFKSGYWSKQWIGNCLAVGLSSGFAEPLEATNIHQTIMQLERFLHTFDFKLFEFNRIKYNEFLSNVFDGIYNYIRFCYTGGRTDSNFWRYMNNNIPSYIEALNEKISNSITTELELPGPIFKNINFLVVAHGLGKINPKKYKRDLILKKSYQYAKEKSNNFINQKNILNQYMISHIEFINNIVGNKKKR
jgi:tryptophan halogenase